MYYVNIICLIMAFIWWIITAVAREDRLRQLEKRVHELYELLNNKNSDQV